MVLDLYKKSDNTDIDGVIAQSLNRAVELTKSEIGFFHFINPDMETISLQVWSAKTMKICDVPKKDSHYPISEAGVWVDCLKEGKPVIHNDYESLANKKGLPEGHAPVIREATIPIFEGDKIVAILGVGNKKENYTDQDVELLNNLSINFWTIIQRKKAETEQKLIEKALSIALTKYKTLFDTFPLGITITDPQGNILETNSMAEVLLGITKEEHLEREIDGNEWKIIRPDKTIMSVEEYASVRALKENKKILIVYT